MLNFQRQFPAELIQYLYDLHILFHAQSQTLLAGHLHTRYMSLAYETDSDPLNVPLVAGAVPLVHGNTVALDVDPEPCGADIVHT